MSLVRVLGGIRSWRLRRRRARVLLVPCLSWGFCRCRATSVELPGCTSVIIHKTSVYIVDATFSKALFSRSLGSIIIAGKIEAVSGRVSIILVARGSSSFFLGWCVRLSDKLVENSSLLQLERGELDTRVLICSA